MKSIKLAAVLLLSSFASSSENNNLNPLKPFDTLAQGFSSMSTFEKVSTIAIVSGGCILNPLVVPVLVGGTVIGKILHDDVQKQMTNKTK